MARYHYTTGQYLLGLRISTTIKSANRLGIKPVLLSPSSGVLPWYLPIPLLPGYASSNRSQRLQPFNRENDHELLTLSGIDGEGAFLGF